MVIVSAGFLLIVLTCIGVGIYLIVTARRALGNGDPRCGSCGYNLTGSASNRCPECGVLFIEAGIVMQAVRTSRVRLWVGVGLLVGVVPLFCLGTGAVMTLRQVEQARRAEAVAMQARAAAMQAQQQAQRAQAQAAAQNQTTTAPASRLSP